MFFALSILAAIGYALQSTLMASYYRTMDRLSAVAYRGLSLGITMLPLLLFAAGSDYVRTPAYFPHILAAAVLAALGNWCGANAYNHLPVGIAGALLMSFAAFVTVVIGAVFLGEVLTLQQLMFIGLVLAGVIGLGATRSIGVLPAQFNVLRGVINSLGFGIFLGAAYVTIGIVSRSLHPFIAGYLWEFVIGIVAAVAALSRVVFGGAGLSIVSKKDFGLILLYSSPTVLGTGCYALALTMGPIGIATAIASTMMVFATLMAYFMYGEKLSRVQWLLLLLVCAAVAGLRV